MPGFDPEPLKRERNTVNTPHILWMEKQNWHQLSQKMFKGIGKNIRERLKWDRDYLGK